MMSRFILFFFVLLLVLQTFQGGEARKLTSRNYKRAKRAEVIDTEIRTSLVPSPSFQIDQSEECLSDAPNNCNIGSSVDIYRNIMAVGNPGNEMVQIFHFIENRWDLRQVIRSSDIQNGLTDPNLAPTGSDGFGTTVALASGKLAIGSGANSRAHVYVLYEDPTIRGTFQRRSIQTIINRENSVGFGNGLDMNNNWLAVAEPSSVDQPPGINLYFFVSPQFNPDPQPRISFFDITGFGWNYVFPEIEPQSFGIGRAITLPRSGNYLGFTISNEASQDQARAAVLEIESTFYSVQYTMEERDTNSKLNGGWNSIALNDNGGFEEAFIGDINELEGMGVVLHWRMERPQAAFVRRNILSSLNVRGGFGSSLAFWQDLVLVGYPGAGTGVATLLLRNEGGDENWGEVQNIDSPKGFSNFGFSVAIFDRSIAIGAPGTRDSTVMGVHTYDYELVPITAPPTNPPPTETPTPTLNGYRFSVVVNQFLGSIVWAQSGADDQFYDVATWYRNQTDFGSVHFSHAKSSESTIYGFFGIVDDDSNIFRNTQFLLNYEERWLNYFYFKATPVESRWTRANETEEWKLYFSN